LSVVAVDQTIREAIWKDITAKDHSLLALCDWYRL